jgi:hypothetical protein
MVDRSGRNSMTFDTLNDLSDRGNDRTPDETEYLLALAVLVEPTQSPPKIPLYLQNARLLF